MPVTDAPIELKTPTGRLSGSLMRPSAANVSFPNSPIAVLIIAGSGPTDRDGNNRLVPDVKNPPLKTLATHLADAGIASVRYDKRGLGDSVAVAEVDLRFEILVDDAIAWIHRLSTELGFSQIVVVGHSEGALIGLLAVLQVPSVCAFVSIAGTSQTAGELLRNQLSSKLSPELLIENERILGALESGFLVTPHLSLANLYRPSVQPYLISWFRHKPTDYFSKLSIPSLIIHGEVDAQVDVLQAYDLQAANPSAQLAILPNMGHTEFTRDAVASITAFIKTSFVCSQV